MKRTYADKSFNQIYGCNLLNFFTAAYLFFAPLTTHAAAGDICSGIFKASEATLSEVFKLKKKPELKQTSRLDDSAEQLRRYILETGVIDTTKLRSEFKHYVELSKTEAVIDQLKKQHPPRFALDGRLISGIASRDGMVKLDTQDLKALSIMADSKSGTSIYDQIAGAGLMSAIKNPLVYSQHRDVVRSELVKLLGQKPTDELLRQVEELHARAIAIVARQGLSTYTDTASTAKFAYRSGVSRDAVLESASNLGLTLKEAEIIHLEKIDFTKLTDREVAEVSTLVTKWGVEKSSADSFVADLRTRSLDEGVIRYRKYRTGNENLKFDGIPAPGSSLRPSNQNIKDAWFADGVTWLEFKMKNTRGEASRSTVVNKPRFPLPDSVLPLVKDPKRFSAHEFEHTKSEIKKAIQETVSLLQTRGIKDAAWNDAEVSAAIDFIRSLHTQGHSLEPVGRTVYMRKSYNLNLVDSAGKSHNVQITRDRHVWELGRHSGNLIQALPYVARQKDWHFQYNPHTGLYEHLAKDDTTVRHVFHPRSPNLVYRVNGDHRILVDVSVEPVEVVEIKVPIKFIKLSAEDIAALPELASVASLRKTMKQATLDLNTRRKNANLSSFAIDKGKRSSSRKDVAGGIQLLINGKKSEFKFHPESGYWVNWSDGASLIYHPSVGVQRLTGQQRIRTVAVPFETLD